MESDCATDLLREVAALPSEPQAIQRLNYSHEAVIDIIIANPGIHQNTIARMLGYSASWLSTVMATDAFQMKLAERREAIVDPILRASLEEQARGLYMRSMEVLREKMNAPAENIPDQLALSLYRESAKVLGYGARPPEPPKGESVNEGLVRHADNLVSLLRRSRREVLEGEATEVSNANGGEDGKLLPTPTCPLDPGAKDQAR